MTREPMMTREPVTEGHRADAGAPDVIVCVPTFRRPEHLAATLDSLVAQTFAGPFAVVVVDNDPAAKAGEAVARAYFADGRLTGLATVEPQQGNCHAINKAFGTALSTYPAARFVLMLDDDEIAAPEWLAHMVETALRTGAGIVGGPVMPQLAPEARPGLARHPAFQPAYAETGPVSVIYGSGNCLITRETFARLGSPAFDVTYNFLGGGDTDFFVRARRAGIPFHWVAEAVISETVPPVRTTFRWLAARGLRVGAINYRIERKHAPGLGGGVAITLKSLLLLPVSLARGARDLAGTRDPLIALHPVLVALGRCLACAGIEPQPYRAAPKPRPGR